jgi:hypothetical protein
MAGNIGKQLEAMSSTTSAPAGAAGASAPWRPAEYDDGPLMVVPAGFLANIVGGLSGTIGEITGGFFGNAPLGKTIGEASSDLVKLLPFQIIPPSVDPQSTGPDGVDQAPQEALVVVPSAFFGGLLAGIGGKLLGGTVGKWLGNEDAGKAAGSTVGGVLGGLLPFQVVPPSVTPQSAGPGGTTEPQEPMVVVPAGFFGNLLGGVTDCFGGLAGGSTGKISKTISPFIKLLPFQAVPPEMLPQSAGPDGGEAQHEQMVVLPAGFFGSLLSGLAGTVGGVVGGLFGDAKAGQDVGNVAAPVLDLLPFHAVPPSLLPQSTGPAGAGDDTSEQMMLVPAGLFGSLLSGLAGTIGGVVGGLFGDAKTGKAVGDLAAPVFGVMPFHTIVPQTATATS